MGKGRTPTSSRSERFLGSFGNNHGQESANGRSELGEDEVWSVVDNPENGDDHSATGGWSSRASMERNGSFGIHRSYRSRLAPPPSDFHRQLGGLSLAFDDFNSSSSPRILLQFRGQDSVGDSPRSHHMAASAPVNVPDWSKIYRADSVVLHEIEDGLNDYDPGVVVPPHEYLAREYARRRRVAANSVFEGVGRTLKGRDLSRVRDAVWSQTRFDG